MKTNPGGQLAPDEVIGRDHLISKLWTILERQSLVLTAERRMGKTSIVKKMAAEPRSGTRVFFRDLEALRSPFEFADCVFQEVRQDLSKKNRAMNRVREFMAQISGAEVMGVKLPQQAAPHWKTILTKTLEDLTEHRDGLLIFYWDELPMMLDNIKRDRGEPTAMEVLDTLRSLRQMLPSVRMVFTGSIGLHHVIARLQEQGYANDPTNDMFEEEIAPLDFEEACNLVRSLLAGEGIKVEEGEAMVGAIAQSVDCFPYYIHHVIDALKWTTQAPRVQQVNEIVQANLCNSEDRWDLAHYRDRINTYYAATEQPLVLGILDELAATEAPLKLRELADRLAVQGLLPDLEQVRKLLTLLGRDHYLVQQTDGLYRFKFELIRRYWQLSRGL